MGVGKTPAHVGDIAAIGAGRAHQVGALARAIAVVGTQDAGALAIAPRQGIQIVLVGVNVSVELVAVARRVGALAAVLVGQGEAVEEALLRAVSVRQRSSQPREAGSGQKQLCSGELHGGDCLGES